MEEKDNNDSNHHNWRGHHHGNPVGAVILIGIGILFLLNNFGIVSWNVWEYIIRFWPVILILIGLQILLGKSYASRIVIVILTIAIVALILWSAVQASQPHGLFPQDRFQFYP